MRRLGQMALLVATLSGGCCSCCSHCRAFKEWGWWKTDTPTVVHKNMEPEIQVITTPVPTPVANQSPVQ